MPELDLASRGFREERMAVARDLVTGERKRIFTGWTRTVEHGEPVMVIAVEDGPTLVLDEDTSQLRVNLAATEHDLEDHRGRQ